MELYRPHGKNHLTNDDAWSWLKKAALPLVVAGASVVAAPLVLSAAGFGAGGIVAGSLAAKGMSAIAMSNGVGVAAGGFFAACQSAGAVGIAGSTLAGIGVATGTAAFAVQEGILGNEKKHNTIHGNNGGTDDDEESENEDEKGSDAFYLINK
ncbi:interferon alpha-inducible protein 27, mitochondrial-like [Mya arenaria]|uniref:interferon alpha-inducible protein 27, mitochondrial-like n=1 Tax=Mya arenaria TaxID=6604 RepID=UPI0022E411FC|nr:interferon alpha-inducible protein 27, mitochondrial-like [Mya arenaria]XP_052775935.1 interferon alpha-inducible protein 27, mitochondrial-like [Mya arenaria]